MYEGSKPPENAEPLDLEYLRALEQTLSEWDSENDDRAYRDL
jgi:antitoxin PrlF